ncbi:MAG TPA: YceI family protein [Puia sp.]|nr:YceI family protein [Puia sp.]
MGRINYEIDKSESSIQWMGKKINGTHNGTINISGGVLTTDNGELAAGEFVADTRSIKILDIADHDTNEQFAGHLASEDFFASKMYPTATLVTSKVSRHVGLNYHIIADLTIRGITQPIEFDAEVSHIIGHTLKASARLVIDRTKYNMKFRSGHFFEDLGDALIYDNFTLNVHLTARTS